MLQTFTDSITRTGLDYAKVLANSSDVGFGKILKKTAYEQTTTITKYMLLEKKSWQQSVHTEAHVRVTL